MSNKIAILISGLLVALSFPTVLFGWHLPNFGFLAWFGLVPLLLAIENAKPPRAFLVGWISATISFLISFYWIYVALHDYGGLSSLISIAILFLFAAANALYIGAACGLARWFTLKTKTEFLIALPVFWTLAEWARNYTPFGGFPWSNLAMSQSNYATLVQIADVTGVYGVIFILVWFNVWLSQSIRNFKKSQTVVTAILIFSVFGYGLIRIHNKTKEALSAPHLKVGLIQPNISQNEKWSGDFLSKHKTIFQEAVRSLQNNVDLIVWPESSWFETLSPENRFIPSKDFFVTASREGKPYSLLGLILATPQNNEFRYFNSAALVDAWGNVVGQYSKVHLVPFGEYVPLKQLFSFLKPVAAIGDFQPGTDLKPLAIEQLKIAPLICYEDIFPELSRAMVKNGANLLVNMTNDAWYGRSSAAYQHLAAAQFRAVETGRAFVRATNTGISAVIDPTGQVVNAAPIFEQSVIVHQIPLLQAQTIYTKLGNWFIAACFLLALVPVVMRKRENK